MCANEGRSSPITRSTSSAMLRSTSGCRGSVKYVHDKAREVVLVAGEQHGQDFITKLAIGHAGSGLVVTCREKHRQQVRFIAPRLPALRDDLIDDRFQLTQRAQNRRFAGSGRRLQFRRPERFPRCAD